MMHQPAASPQAAVCVTGFRRGLAAGFSHFSYPPMSLILIFDIPENVAEPHSAVQSRSHVPRPLHEGPS